MSQIEDVTRRAAKRIEHAPHLLAHAGRWRGEYRGIKIALQRNSAANPAARI
jgi:hypothetical protein